MTAASDILRVRPYDARAFQRIMTASFAIHIGVVLLFVVVPRGWLFHERPQPKLMEVTLGGSLGPETGGMTSIGGRPIEQVAPEPKRPEPIRPASPKSDAIALPTRKTTPEKPQDTAKPPTPLPKPPTTGKQITPGTALAETGAQGMGTGLTVGGAAGSSVATLEVNPDTFCCMAYVQFMLNAINNNWQKDLPGRGTTTLKFTLLRNGTITDVSVQESSGSSMLDLNARAALQNTHLKPLPPEFTDERLVIHLKFPYGG